MHVRDVGTCQLDRPDRREDRSRPIPTPSLGVVHAEQRRKNLRIELAQESRGVAERRGLQSLLDPRQVNAPRRGLRPDQGNGLPEFRADGVRAARPAVFF